MTELFGEIDQAFGCIGWLQAWAEALVALVGEVRFELSKDSTGIPDTVNEDDVHEGCIAVG
jgi:hypothetical protein